MSENDEQATNPKGKKPVWVENFIRRLQAQGFVQWDPCTWIHPKDIPWFTARLKITRSRRRRREFKEQLRERRGRCEES
jgi:hypothetical protein